MLIPPPLFAHDLRSRRVAEREEGRDRLPAIDGRQGNPRETELSGKDLQEDLACPLGRRDAPQGPEEEHAPPGRLRPAHFRHQPLLDLATHLRSGHQFSHGDQLVKQVEQQVIIRLDFDRPQQQPEKLRLRELAGGDARPERSEQQQTPERIGDRREIGDHRRPTALVEQERSVPIVFIIGKDVSRGLVELQLERFRLWSVELAADGPGRAIGEGDQKLGLDRPVTIALLQVALLDGDQQPLRCVFIRRPVGLEAGHPALVDPGAGPPGERAAGDRFETGDEIPPVGITEGMAPEKELNPGPKDLRSKLEAEGPQNRRRLLVDDRAVGRLGVDQVRNLLVNGCGAARAIDRVRRWFVMEMEPLPDIPTTRLTRCQGGHGRVGEVVGEPLLDPQIIKPAHGHQIPEPLVNQFVQNERRAGVPIGSGGLRREEDRLFPQVGCAGVLHAPKRESRKQHLVVLVEREGGAEILDERADPGRRQVRDRWPLRAGPFQLGSANEEAQRHAVSLGSQGGEVADGEREEIGAQRRALREGVPCPLGVQRLDADWSGVGDDLQAGRDRQTQPEAPLQVGLIEAGKGEAGIHRHRQQIDEPVAIGRIIEADQWPASRGNGRDKVDQNLILSLAQLVGGEDEVAARLLDLLDQPPVDHQSPDRSVGDRPSTPSTIAPQITKIEDYRSVPGWTAPESKADPGFSGQLGQWFSDGARLSGPGQVETERVTQIMQLFRTPLRQLPRDAHLAAHSTFSLL